MLILASLKHDKFCIILNVFLCVETHDDTVDNRFSTRMSSKFPETTPDKSKLINVCCETKLTNVYFTQIETSKKKTFVYI